MMEKSEEDVVFEGLATELFKSNAIIKHALALMTEEQKTELYKLCAFDRILSDPADEFRVKWRKAILHQTVMVGVQICRQCGCTDTHGCLTGCYWEKPDLCSQCSNHANFHKRKEKR